MAIPPGVMTPYAGDVAPAGWLMCDGTAYSRSTYAGLFAKLVTSKGTATVTIASPGVWTLNSHGLSNGDVIYLESTGALPTGLSVASPYYIVNATTNTFQLSSTKGGAAINTSGTQSGTHTVFRAPWALGTMGGTTFNVPNMNGRSPIGKNNATFLNLGAQGGEESHTLSLPEIPVHSHGGSTSSISAGTPAGSVTVNGSGVLNTGIESNDHVHSGTTDSGGAAGSLITGYSTLDVTTGGTSARINTLSLLTSAHTHTYTTSGRSSVHTHAIADHAHTASFAGTALGAHSHTITAEGGGGTHNNLHPYVVLNFIIKT